MNWSTTVFQECGPCRRWLLLGLVSAVGCVAVSGAQPLTLGPQVLLAGGGVHESRPRVAMAGDGSFAMIWTEWTGPGPTDERLVGRRFNADATARDAPFEIATGRYMQARVAAGEDGGFLFVWSGHRDLGVQGRLCDLTGVLGDTFRFSPTYAGYYHSPSVVAAPGGGYLTVWSTVNFTEDRYGLTAQRLTDRAEPWGGEIELDVDSRVYNEDSAVALADDGSFLVAWGRVPGIVVLEVHARHFAADGTPLGPEMEVNRRPDASGDPIQHRTPEVAFSSDRGFLILWKGSFIFLEGLGAGTEVAAKMVSDDFYDVVLGRWYVSGELSTELWVSPRLYGFIDALGVASLEDGMLIVWGTEGSDGMGRVGGRLWPAFGSPPGPFTIDDSAVSGTAEVAVAAAPGGRGVVAWNGEPPAGESDGRDLRGRLFELRAPIAGIPTLDGTGLAVLVLGLVGLGLKSLPRD